MASGILGSYTGVYALSFTACLNMGQISSKNSSVGGIISTLGENYDDDSVSFATYTRTHRLTGSYDLDQKFAENKNYSYGKINKLNKAEFINTVNSSIDIGGTAKTSKQGEKSIYASRFVGGIFGYAYNVDIAIYSAMNQSKLTATAYIKEDGTTLDSYAGGIFGYAKVFKEENSTQSLVLSTLKEEIVSSIIKYEENTSELEDIYNKYEISANYAGGLFGYIYSEGNLFGHINDNIVLSIEENELKTIDQIKKDNATYNYNSKIGKYTNDYLQSPYVKVKGKKASSGILAKYEGKQDSQMRLVFSKIKNTSKVIGADNFIGASGILSTFDNVKALYFDNCTNDATIIGYDETVSDANSFYAGGIIAYLQNGILANPSPTLNAVKYVEIANSSTGEQSEIISGKNEDDGCSVGGFVGCMVEGTSPLMKVKIYNSRTHGKVELENAGYDSNNNLAAGGFIGYADVAKLLIGDEDIKIGRSYNYANISSSANAGGIIGYNSSKNTEIVNTYNYYNIKQTGKISYTGAGGFIGKVDSADSTYIYNTAQQLESNSIIEGYQNIGGVIGLVVGDRTAIHFNKENVDTKSVTFKSTLNSTLTASSTEKSYGGGIIGTIGVITDSGIIDIENVVVKANINTTYAGGIIGSSYLQNSLIIGGETENEKVEVVGSIGSTYYTLVSGGVIGYYGAIAEGLQFGSILINQATISATKYLGGVVGQDDTNSLDSVDTSNIHLSKVKYVGYNYKYDSSYSVWTYEKEEVLDEVTGELLMTIAKLNVNANESTLVVKDKDSNELGTYFYEYYSPVTQGLAYNAFYTNSLGDSEDRNRFNYYAGNRDFPFKGKITHTENEIDFKHIIGTVADIGTWKENGECPSIDINYDDVKDNINSQKEAIYNPDDDPETLEDNTIESFMANNYPDYYDTLKGTYDKTIVEGVRSSLQYLVSYTQFLSNELDGVAGTEKSALVDTESNVIFEKFVFSK